MSTRTVTLGGAALRIADIVAVAHHAMPVQLDASVLPRLSAARAVLDRAVADGAPIYGVTTGLGANVDTPLAPSEVASFQKRAVAARAVGVGPELSAETIRASLFVRLAGLARGTSGVSPPLVETLEVLLNARVVPVARSVGSLGEADLAPLAEMMLPLVGGGEAWFDGERLPGAEALRRAGIAVPPLAAKDGVALFNASAVSVATAALAQHDLACALDAAAAAAALSLEAFRANLSVIDESVVALRPAPGHARGATLLRALLHGSDLWAPDPGRRVQDPLSIRCVAPVHGVALDRLDEAADAIETDLNGAGDSPAILVETGEILSTVNFDTTAIALALEALGLAAAHVAALATFRICKLMSPSASGLPRFLAAEPGVQSGFAPAQKTAAALEAEIRHLSRPIGPMVAPVADGVEDYAPMTPAIAAKTHGIARYLARLAAVELVVAAAACDLRPDIRLGRGTSRTHAILRQTVPHWDEDRPTGVEFERVAERILAGHFGNVAA